MNFSEFFIRRPVMTIILMATVLIGGFWAYVKLPVTDLPNVDYPIINVNVSYTGASPEVMSRTVVMPLEKELANVNGIRHITSQSNRGFAGITLIFDLDHDINQAAQDVQAALKKAEQDLPPDLDQLPSYQKANTQDQSIIYLVLTSNSSSLADLYDCAHQRIEQKISRLEGVGSVKVHGSPYALRIKVDPELMAARGLTFEEVKTAIGQTLGSLPVGVLDTPGRKFNLEVPATFRSAADFANLHLTSDVRLKEIAEVVDSLESDLVFRFLSKNQDDPAVILGIQKKSGANAVKISEELQKLISEIKSEIPPSMELKIWFDKAHWIKEAIQDVEWSLVIAFALVVIVVYLSLGRFRETLVAATALPLSIIGTFIIMQWLHFNLDLLSLLALTLAMGFVIDDAIVVLENIVRHQEKGLSPLQAAVKGSKEIGFTVISMTLSLVAVFIPLLLMKDITGRLFREFSITLAVAILVSGVVSLALTPMLCSKFLSSHRPSSPARWNLFLLSFYQRSLKWCLAHGKTTLGVALAAAVLTVFLFRNVSINLFPEEDRGFVWTHIQMPSGMSKEDVEIYQRKMDRVVKNNSAIESMVALNFKDYYMYLLRLTPAEKRPPQVEVIDQLQKDLSEIPGIQPFLRGVQLISPEMGGSSKGSGYQFIMRGSDLELVRASAETLKQKLMALPAFLNPDLMLKADDPKLEIIIEEEQAEKLGLNRQMIQTLLQNAYAGGSIGKIERASEQYKVILELNSQSQKNSEALSKLYLKTASGASIPLKAVAHWKENVGLQNIEHIDLLPAVVLMFDVAKETPIDQALDTLKTIAAQTLPGSVSGKLEGMAQMVDSTTKDTIFLLVLAMAAMYVVLGILYESFIHPLTILSALPFACLGGILTLLIFKEPLSLYSMVGFLLLIGIVKKNGIMMIDYALELQKQENRPILVAIEEACHVRFRPIMMTTLAAIMGALPIAIGIGPGAETRRGLGLVIVGGLIFSQILTLYITPVIFHYLEKLRARKKTTSAV